VTKDVSPLPPQARLECRDGRAHLCGGFGSDLMRRVRRFMAPIAVKGRILVGADNRLYAFKTH